MGPITDSLKHLDIPGLDQVEVTWQRCNRAVDSLSHRLSRDDSSKLLVYQLLQVNPNERITCQQALTTPFLSSVVLAIPSSLVSSNVPSHQDPPLDTHNRPEESTASADVNSDVTTERSEISIENQMTKNGKNFTNAAVRCAQCIKKRKLQQCPGHGSNAPSSKRPAVEGLVSLPKRHRVNTLSENKDGTLAPRVTGFIGADRDVPQQRSPAPSTMHMKYSSGPRTPSGEPPVIVISSDEEDSQKTHVVFNRGSEAWPRSSLSHKPTDIPCKPKALGKASSHRCAPPHDDAHGSKFNEKALDLTKRRPLASLSENRGDEPKPRVAGRDHIGANHDVPEQRSTAPLHLQMGLASGPRTPSGEPPVREEIPGRNEDALNLHTDNMNSTDAGQVFTAVRPTANNESPEDFVIVDDS